MEKLTSKGRSGPRKAIPDDVPVIETKNEPGVVDIVGETSATGLATSAESRRARERRQINILGLMMTGNSFLLKR